MANHWHAAAIKRLASDLKELQRNPLVGANAEPDENNFLKWYALVVPEAGPYKGCPIAIELEFPADYPNNPPNGFFCTHFAYQGGARMQDARGRYAVCLDLFGNFGRVAHGWDKDGVASGWSPSYTVSSILLALTALMDSEMVDRSPSSVEETLRAARSYKNPRNGHNGSLPAKYRPQVLSLAEVQKFHEACAMDVDRLDERKFDPFRDHYISYADRETAAGGAILGYGVSAEGGYVKKLSSPCEYLSRHAFAQQQVRASSLNKLFTHWLPLYISKEHWRQAASLFDESVSQLAQLIAAPKGVAGTLKVFASLMNSMVVEVSLVKDHATANDKFVDGYWALLTLLKNIREQDPTLVAAADAIVERFLESSQNRSKNQCPDLGEFLIVLLACSKFTWKDVAQAFVEESDARNVKWYVEKGHPELDTTAAVPGRLQNVFAATSVSRTIVAFQVQFMQLASKLSLQDLLAEAGLPTAELRATIKQSYATIVAFKTWQEYFEFLGIPPCSDEQRTVQLQQAVKNSQACGYHKSGGANGGHGGKGAGRGGYGGNYNHGGRGGRRY